MNTVKHVNNVNTKNRHKRRRKQRANSQNPQNKSSVMQDTFDSISGFRKQINLNADAKPFIPSHTITSVCSWIQSKDIPQEKPSGQTMEQDPRVELEKSYSEVEFLSSDKAKQTNKIVHTEHIQHGNGETFTKETNRARIDKNTINSPSVATLDENGRENLGEDLQEIHSESDLEPTIEHDIEHHIEQDLNHDIGHDIPQRRRRRRRKKKKSGQESEHENGVISNDEGFTPVGGSSPKHQRISSIEARNSPWSSPNTSIQLVKSEPQPIHHQKNENNAILDAQPKERKERKITVGENLTISDNEDFPVLSATKHARKTILSYSDVVSNKHHIPDNIRSVSNSDMLHPSVRNPGVLRVSLSEFIPVSKIEPIKEKKQKTFKHSTPDDTDSLQKNVNSLLQSFLNQRAPLREMKRINIKVEKGKRYKMEDIEGSSTKVKKITRLKRVILQERQEKQQEDKTTKRKFREFVSTKLTQTTDNNVVELLSKLSFFQKRLLQTYPLKYKQHKRIAIGLKETLKACQRNRAKAIIMAPDIEKISSKGGLDSLVGNILREATSREVPVVFALNRRKLGIALGKTVHISVVCIINAEGAFELLSKLLKELEYFEEDEELRLKKRRSRVKELSPISRKKNADEIEFSSVIHNDSSSERKAMEESAT